MRKTQISAEIVAHSKRPVTGEELITYRLTFPRIILAEINTYKMLSKNTSSSRAIPFEKIVEVVEKDPFIPIAWQKQHRGMQGYEYWEEYEKGSYEPEGLNYPNITYLNGAWNMAKDMAIEQAKTLNRYGATKQLVNRLLEPFMWVTQLVTGTRESFEHLFNQRCPVYPGCCKSWKELCDLDSNYTMETPIIKRLEKNKGQAEIHFMDLAEKMYDALQESIPNELFMGSYHIPFLKDIISSEEMLGVDNLITMSVALTARVSYTSIGDDNKLTLKRAKDIYNHCLENGHWSVFEHIGQCMRDSEYEHSIRQIDGQGYDTKGWYKNFKGFKQLRGILELQEGIIK